MFDLILMKKLLIFYLWCFSLFAGAQEALHFASPFDFPLYLSANFGELRPNHFHGGLDIKTQGVIGKQVQVVADGYVSRISVSPSGYGNAIYVVHPNGYTSVYGHLDSFVPQIARYVREQQYKQESFAVNLFPDSTLFHFKQGEVIALSGNTGSSGGPHLHLELRETTTNELIDPLPFYMHLLKDTRRPLSKGIMLYAFPGQGVVNGSSRKQNFVWHSGGASLNRPVNAWGKIGVAIRANDYMTDTSNVYGVRSIRLLVDSIEVFCSVTDRVSFLENRAINGWIDYDVYRRTRSLYAKSFLLPGSSLRLTRSSASDRGWVTIDEERDYHFLYILEDSFGNVSRYSFVVHGQQQPILPYKHSGNRILKWNKVNNITFPGMQVVIPKGMLYEDVEIDAGMEKDSTSVSFVYRLHDKILPLHDFCSIKIGVRDTSALIDSSKYYIAEKTGKSMRYIGGEWKDGWLEGKIRNLGTYTVGFDTIPPTITPLNRNRWTSSGRISLNVSDKQTGMASYKGKIDGRFVLFECNRYYSRLTCNLRKEQIKRGSIHTLEMTVVDNRGNKTVYTEKFRY